MKLNKQGRDELRKSVEVLLNAAPDNKKIQLSNETLEQLLFDTYVVNKEKGIKVKLPVWSGEFLRKLDLSRVSFEDVSWFIIGALDIDALETYDYYDKLKEIIEPYKNRRYKINYANTNARIDLSKSFEAKNCQKIYVQNCDFKNINFLNFDLSSDDYVDMWFQDSDFSNTNLKFVGFLIPDSVINSNFSNVDLSRISADAIKIINGAEFSETNLTNTKLNISLDTEKIKLQKDPHYNEYYYKKELKNYMEKYWVGCYLNGKLIKPSEEKQQSASEIKEEYETFKSSEIAGILGSIAEQMDSSGPKR